MARVPQGRVTLSGHVAGGQDIWTMGFAIGPQGARSTAQMQATVDDIAGKFQTYVWTADALDQYIPADVTWESVRLDDVDDPGGIVRSVFKDLPEPLSGSSANFSLPTECSVVVSLLTGLPGGRRRGRMYFPPFAINAVGVGGTLGGGAQGALADAFEDFFNQVNSSAAVASSVFVASDANQDLTLVTSIRVGSVIDSQRRRRNSMVELYTVRDVVGP